MRTSGFYEVDGKLRHMTDFKADRQRAMGKEVKGPIEDKAMSPAGDKGPSLKELRAEAKEAGVSGYSTMGKAKLVEALNG